MLVVEKKPNCLVMVNFYTQEARDNIKHQGTSPLLKLLLRDYNLHGVDERRGGVGDDEREDRGADATDTVLAAAVEVDEREANLAAAALSRENRRHNVAHTQHHRLQVRGRLDLVPVRHVPHLNFIYVDHIC